jgi:2-methylcitrate dehydratase PrpD
VEESGQGLRSEGRLTGIAVAPEDVIARTLSGFAQGLALERVPSEVSERARHLMLDAIGCALAARREPFALKFTEATRSLSDPGSRGVVGFGDRMPLRDAALLNGVLMHGLDYDDTHMSGIVHLSVSVLPTVLALASEHHANGADMLAAYITGLEAGARIGTATRGGLHTHGFHPTGVVGVFGSTLAAGRLLGLDAAQLVHAQGFALSMASGSLQFLEDGAWTKRMHPGWAAQSAINAANFAAHGLPAPQSPYEGRYGFYRCYLGQDEYARIDLSLATAGLGADGIATTWELMNVAVKPFPMCHFVHASTDAAIALHKTGIDATRIRSVEVAVPAGVVQSVCEPVANKRRPQSDYDAKFSLNYAVASGLLRGRLGLKELTPEAFGEPAALALMDRITYVDDPDTTFPSHYTGEVRVTLDDGRTLRHRESINRGHAERPVTNAEVREKFFENATMHFPRSHALAICEHVLALDRLVDVQTLESLLAKDASLQN